SSSVTLAYRTSGRAGSTRSRDTFRSESPSGRCTTQPRVFVQLAPESPLSHIPQPPTTIRPLRGTAIDPRKSSECGSPEANTLFQVAPPLRLAYTPPRPPAYRVSAWPGSTRTSATQASDRGRAIQLRPPSRLRESLPPTWA